MKPLRLKSIDIFRIKRVVHPLFQFCVGLGFLCLLHTQTGHAQGVIRGNDEVLRFLRDALARYASLDLEASVRGLQEGSDGDDAGPIVEELVLRVKRLGTRSLISTKGRIERPSNDPWFFQKDFIVFDNGDVLLVQAKLNPSFQQTDDANSDLGVVLFSKRLAGTQELDRQSLYLGLNDSGAALWIIGYAPLTDYLDGASDIVIDPNPEGAEVRLDGKFGQLKLDLSSAHGWLPQSFKLTKARGHEMLGHVIGDSSDGTVTKSISWTGEVKGFNKDETGQWAPQRMEIVRRSVREPLDGSIKTTIEFERVEYAPLLASSDFETELDIPVGFPVSLAGGEHLPFKWNGTAVVPGLPEMPFTPDIIDESIGSSGKRAFLIALNVSLIIVLLLLFWRKRSAT